MDADDLVITLKKSLAKLSRTERRKAVELVGDVVRAAMFDDAAGDDCEIERCPRCGSTAVVKKGRSRNGDQRYLCRGCGRTFSGSTGQVLGRSRLPRETWMAYAECFALMLPLRECSARCGVCLKTAYTMRHRLIECLSAYSPSFRVERGCGCELDETYFPESFKGNHSKGSFTLPRKARHRGKQVRRRGLSREQICVMTGVSDTDATFFEVSGRGAVSRRRAAEALRDRIGAGAAVATLISRAFEVAVLCVYAAVSRRLPLMPRALLHPGRVIAKDFAKYALPVVCNECLWSLAFSLYTVIMGHMADNTPILSAYTIAGNLQRMMTPASFAAGGAAAVLIGREIGRGNRGSVQRKAWVLDALALVVGFVCMGIIALVRNVLLRPYILPLMHMEGEACDIAMYMMGILMLVQPVSSVSLTNIVGVLRGGGDVRYAMLCDVGPLYAVCLPLAALAALVWKLDIRYVYPLMSIDVIVQIFLCFPRLRSGRWIHDVTRGAGELEA